MSPIKRHSQRSAPHFFIYFVIVEALFFVCAGRSFGNYQWFGSTYIVTAVSPDFVVVGAESLIADEQGKPASYECKIVPLNSHRLFFDTGRTIFNNDTSGQSMLNGVSLARSIYYAATPLAELSERWASGMEAGYYTLARINAQTLLQGLENDFLADGSFAGLDTDGIPAVASAPIRYSRSDIIGVRFSHDPIQRNTSPAIAAHGVDLTTYSREFLMGETPRAIGVHRALNEEIEARRLQGADVIALQLRRLIETVINWSNDPRIGGQVSVAVVERGGLLRWFRQSAVCGGSDD